MEELEVGGVFDFDLVQIVKVRFTSSGKLYSYICLGFNIGDKK